MQSTPSEVAAHARTLGDAAATIGYRNVLVSNTEKLSLTPDLIYRLRQPVEDYTREPDPDFLADIDMGYIEK